jgi:RNA polymerase sigma-70 factor (ECF subfamily)
VAPRNARTEQVTDEKRQERRDEKRQERRDEKRQERRDEMRSERTDEEILARVRAGETRRFEELVLRYQDAIYGMALRFVGSSAEAQDIAQEVFLRVHRGLEGFKGEARFSTWLYRIAFNLCSDTLRRRRRPDRASVSLEEAGEIQDRRAGFEQGILDSEQRRAVRAALEGMDEKYRAVLILLYYQELSYEQIAAVLQCPLKTVETRLYRARRHLRPVAEREGWST